MSGGPLDHVKLNAQAWDARRDDQLQLARRQWAATEPNWGVFAIPESLAGILPANLKGTNAVELGCGTGYVSAWLARSGATPVAVDPSPGQLRIARQLQDETGIRFPLSEQPASRCPFATGHSTS